MQTSIPLPKKLFRIFSSLAALLFFVLCAPLCVAQDASSLIPLNPKLRMGSLPNGMTYYVLNNKDPKERIELRLVVRAGGIDEDDDQQGMAHFVEHMLFNGTKSFKKNEVLEFFQSIGISFGGDSNAYTSTDETVYFIHAPSADTAIVSKCFLLFKEWMHEASFEGEEIENERGVVAEEERVRRTFPSSLFYEGLQAKALANTKYAERNVIGSNTSIMKTPQENIRKYYKDWYRPDLMSFIVVGDLDADYMEQLIKRFFSAVPVKDSPRKKEKIAVATWEDDIYYLQAHPDVSTLAYLLSYRSDEVRTPINTSADLRKSYVYSLGTSILDARFSEMVQDETLPLVNVGTSYGSFLADERIKGHSYNAQLYKDKEVEGIEALNREIQRALTHGFTEKELAASKKRMLTYLEETAKEQKTWDSDRWARSIVQHAVSLPKGSRVALSTPKQDYELAKPLIEGITLEEVVAAYKKGHQDTKRLQAVLRNTDSEEELTQAVVKIAAAKGLATATEAYVSTAQAYDSFVPNPPAPATIESKKEFSIEGVTEVRFSNGATVYLKPTKFEENKIQFQATSLGGASLLGDDILPSRYVMGAAIDAMGLGDFSRKDIKESLADKDVRLNFFVGEETHGLSGNSVVEDLEIALQLMYLGFTNPRKNEKRFNTMMKRRMGQAKQFESFPVASLVKNIGPTIYDNHPRYPRTALTVGDLERVKYGAMEAIHTKLYGNASDFTFLMVGDFEIDKVMPLLATYIGGLPAAKRDQAVKVMDRGLRHRTESLTKAFPGGEDGSSFMLAISFSPTTDSYDVKTQVSHLVANQVFSMVILEKLREKAGKSYSPSGSISGYQEYPIPHYSGTLFVTSAEKDRKKLLKIAKKEIAKIQKGKIKKKDLKKAKEILAKNYEENIEENSYWLGFILNTVLHGHPAYRNKKYKDQLNAVTLEDVQQAVTKAFSLDNLLVLYSAPEGKGGK